MKSKKSEIIVCPKCKGEVEQAKEELRCGPCKLAFPLRGEIAVMLLDEARALA